MGYKCYLSTVVSEKKRSFVIEGNRSLAWAVLPRFCREYSKEALREMRNRSCACGRVSPFSPLLFNFSSLSLVRPGLLTYRRPDADTVLTSSIPGDDDLQFQTNSSFPPSLSLFLFFSLSFFPSSGPLVCPWTDAALVKREFQDFQIALRSLGTLLENSEERTFFRSFCIERSCR